MKHNSFIWSFKCYALIHLASLTSACNSSQPALSSQASVTITDSVTLMMTNITKDISAKGPAAWLSYFEDSPNFFMASDGQLALKDYPTAKTFISGTLVKVMPHIKLQWNNVRIDPLTSNLASISADFHEDATNTTGKVQPFDGYFTGLAHLSNGWKLRNLHWSMKKPTN